MSKSFGETKNLLDQTGSALNWVQQLGSILIDLESHLSLRPLEFGTEVEWSSCIRMLNKKYERVVSDFLGDSNNFLED